MMEKKSYSLAYSSCPNDTFIFKALAAPFIDRDGMNFDIHLDDVETLNQHALTARFDITKLSVAALGRVLDEYTLLRTGAALGNGCGPLLICADGHIREESYKTVAVPGLHTTAYYLFSFYHKERFPHGTVKILPMPFDQIMPAIQDGKVHAGVIIHEGRFVYQQMGFHKIADLGQWWEDKTGLPIPLGCIAMRRTLGAETVLKMESLIRDSIAHGFAHPALGRDYICEHAKELDDAVIDQHISLYVNEYSMDLGSKGEHAIKTFFSHAAQVNLMESGPWNLFVK